MKNSRIHFINLGIIVAYMLILTAIFKRDAIGLSIIPIAVQIVVNGILSLSNLGKDVARARTYLLSALLVWLVGYSSCAGIEAFVERF